MTSPPTDDVDPFAAADHAAEVRIGRRVLFAVAATTLLIFLHLYFFGV